MILKAGEGKRDNLWVKEEYDLVIVGGGLSGVCCALAAAREGSRVALVQDRPVLGGNASSEVRVWALGATSHMGNNNRWAREGGIIDELMVENLYRNPEGNPLLFDALLIDKVEAEQNIDLLLNTMAYDVNMRDANRIGSVVAFNSMNQTTYELSANYFCDASGDGIVAYLAGAAYRMGAEGKEEFGEGFSPSAKYGELLGHTLFLYTKKCDKKIKFVAPDFALKDMTSLPKLHQITPNQQGCNYWWFEYGGTLDTIADTEKIKKELWKVAYGAWDYIKNSGNYPEADNMTLEWIGVIPGKRESRRFEGLYMLRQQDIVEQTHFPDAVAYGGWAIDLHPAEGMYSPLPSCNQYHSEGIYEIPYRCYVSRNIDNLFLAGRLISVSHVAFGSTRVMITCALGGQAVGCAASLCKKHNCMPADLLENTKMAELQQALAKNGQSIPSVKIATKGNLAAQAQISASSSLLFSGFEGSDKWRVINQSMGQLLPLKGAVKYSVCFEFDATEATNLTIDLVASRKEGNYTPNRFIERITINLKKGKQKAEAHFSECLPKDAYAFVILRSNPLVSTRMSNERITGITSVFNKINKAVNNQGRQMPPDGSGFREFEFFTPERRPAGQNIAFRINPPLDCFQKDNVVNGFTRPSISANAWVAAKDDNKPELIINFPTEQKINEIKLYFDTDFDHPMETVQWGHPERTIPFCVSDYALHDAAGKVLAEIKGNHHTINSIKVDEPIVTKSLRLVFGKKEPLMPVALFQILIQ